MRFEWDSKKNRINQTRHNGLDFETATRVFDDPRVVLMQDRIIEGERRWHAIGAVSAALLLVSMYTVRTMSMTKKSSASSRRGKLIRVSAESIFSKPLNKRQKGVLARIAKRQVAGDDSGIDYSDIPPLTDEQLARFRRASKVLVAARLDRDVYDWLKKYGKGYSTRINSILRAVMSRAR